MSSKRTTQVIVQKSGVANLWWMTCPYCNYSDKSRLLTETLTLFLEHLTTHPKIWGEYMQYEVIKNQLELAFAGDIERVHHD